MANTALIIAVAPSAELVEAGTRERAGLRSRLFGPVRALGRKSAVEQSLDVHGFTKPLLVDLAAYLRERLEKPWEATRFFLESYLFGVEHKALVRGRRDDSGQPWQWTLELTFNDCAGMAAVSMQLAAHWAERWYAARRPAVEEEILRPNGLEPRDEPVRVSAAPALFLPAGGLGYAARLEDAGLGADRAMMPRAQLVLDAAYGALTDGAAEAAYRYLEEYGLPLTDDGRCHCQLCMPQLDGDALMRPQEASSDLLG
jgi:hypothetical protein